MPPRGVRHPTDPRPFELTAHCKASGRELQPYGELAALTESRACRRYGALMGIQYRTHHGQADPQTGSRPHCHSVGPDKEIKDMRHRFGSDADPVIAHLNHGMNPTRTPGPTPESLPPASEHFRRIGEQIDEHLLQLTRMRPRRGQLDSGTIDPGVHVALAVNSGMRRFRRPV